MRRLLILFLIILLLPQQASALDYTAPSAPQSAQKYMPPETDSFVDGVWYVLKTAVQDLCPDISEAAKTCLSVIAVIMLLSLVQSYSGVSQRLAGLVGAISLGVLLFRSTDSLIHLGTQTIEVISDYGRLLIPVLAAATAASGATVTSSALYTGTMVFSSVLSTLASRLVVPFIYILMVLGVADCAVGGKVFQGLKDFVKWLSTMIIKVALYIFTGYMSVTGVISGSVDSTAVKATKLTISGVVPVVGGIISDASETILLSAGIMRNSVGIYGMLVTIAVCVGPFLQIGVHYLMLKLTAAVCGIFADKQCSGLLKNMTTVMGLVMAMTGTVGLMLLISIVSFLRSLT